MLEGCCGAIGRTVARLWKSALMWMLCLSVFPGPHALAGEQPVAGEAAGEDAQVRNGLPEMLALGMGYSGVFRQRDRPVYSVEYRFRESRKGLHTAVLLGWNSDARYLNFSLGYSRFFGRYWTAMIATGPGVYSRDTDGDDLGSPLEFLSRIEVARVFARQRRLGLRLSHISNAHVSPHNPGNESLALVFALSGSLMISKTLRIPKP